MSTTSPGGSDVSHEPLLKQLGSLGSLYWIANWIEGIERFAWCGVRVVAPVFIVAAFEDGGPQLTQIQKGDVFAVWAMIQTFVPILSGGFADRFGYKLNIACSIVLTCLGYLVMGHSVLLAEMWAGMPLGQARAAGLDHAYPLLFAGTILIGFGTAIFKPGVQGLIANQIPKSAASLGWGVFYQVVNIGGGFGPLLAGPLRKTYGWNSVFLVCAGALTLNFIPLLLFREPARQHDPNRISNPIVLLYNAVRGLLEPRLFFFTISFAGFWLMFYQLFDILPNFIDDWVDSRGPAGALKAVLGAKLVPIGADGNLPQEWLIFVNFLLISCMAFFVSYLTGKMRSLSAMVIGIAVAAVAIFALGLSMNGWWIIAAIAIFSFGEMMASPTKMRYLSNIAPEGKKGQYMGYVNFTVGIGWSLGSVVAGHLYEHGGDKVVLARRYLVEHQNLAKETVEAISKNNLLPFFEKTVGVDAWQTRQILWEAYHPYSMWLVFALIGLGSMVALVVYDRVVQAADARASHSLNTHGYRWTQAFLYPLTSILLGVTVYHGWATATFSPGLVLVTGFFGIMSLVALADSHETQM